MELLFLKEKVMDVTYAKIFAILILEVLFLFVSLQ